MDTGRNQDPIAMKRTQKILANITIAVGAVALIAFGQIVRPLPVPVEYRAANGTAFGVNQSGVPYVKSGTNIYTGATTNVAYSNGAATNTLLIVNGIIRGVQ